MCLQYSYSNDSFTLKSLKTVPWFYSETAVIKQIKNVKQYSHFTIITH